ncbi:hypothetical protein CR159_05800 [Pollutimonas subterranea]|uniref:Uncharacterized protein n=1 Tax=Pollutimonas subterranea TaxID=2045210 RepID=A0A2N4U7V8_9BURK|nr:hypothetical protein CR159_05800 [Pollutimonas subterranea]
MVMLCMLGSLCRDVTNKINCARIQGNVQAFSGRVELWPLSAFFKPHRWLECRVGPMKYNDMGTLALFDTFFASPDLVWVEMNREVVELAPAIRVRHGLRSSYFRRDNAANVYCKRSLLYLSGHRAKAHSE